MTEDEQKAMQEDNKHFMDYEQLENDYTVLFFGFIAMVVLFIVSLVYEIL